MVDIHKFSKFFLLLTYSKFGENEFSTRIFCTKNVNLPTIGNLLKEVIMFLFSIEKVICGLQRIILTLLLIQYLFISIDSKGKSSSSPPVTSYFRLCIPLLVWLRRLLISALLSDWIMQSWNTITSNCFSGVFSDV